MPKLIATGVPWFNEAGYERLRAVSIDRDALPETFAEWREMAQRRFDQIVAGGLDLTKVMIDPDEMAAWCRAHGRQVDASARAAYAAILVGQQHGKRH